MKRTRIVAEREIQNFFDHPTAYIPNVSVSWSEFIFGLQIYLRTEPGQSSTTVRSTSLAFCCLYPGTDHAICCRRKEDWNHRVAFFLPTR